MNMVRILRKVHGSAHGAGTSTHSRTGKSRNKAVKSPKSLNQPIPRAAPAAAHELHIVYKVSPNPKGEGSMRRQHIEVGIEEALQGVAKTGMHKRSVQPKDQKAQSNTAPAII